MSPAEAAKIDQYNANNYPGIDNWQDCSLYQGNIVYVWECDGQTNHGNGNAYATTPDTVLGCNGDPDQLHKALQTNLDPRYNSHRGHLQAYRINEETFAAFAHCEANTCHGSGGGEQYYIPNFDEHLQNCRIEKADDLNLDFSKDTLSISDAQSAAYQKNTLMQPSEQTPTPSQNTTPTLDGSYTGPTPNKAFELKPQVDATQNQWNNNLAGELAAKPKQSEPPNKNEIAGKLPEEIPIQSESNTKIAGTTPDKAENIDLSDRNLGSKAEQGLAEGVSKKTGDSINSATGIT